MEADPPIDEIRRVRHEISAECDHDPKKLVAYYKELQRQYRGQLVNFGSESPSVILNDLAPDHGGTSATAS